MALSACVCLRFDCHIVCVSVELQEKVSPVLAYLERVELSEARRHLHLRREDASVGGNSYRARGSEQDIRRSIAEAINWHGGLSEQDTFLYLSKVNGRAGRCLSLPELWCLDDHLSCRLDVSPRHCSGCESV